MAYPTTMDWRIISPEAALQSITETSTIQNHPLGHCCMAKDDSHNEAEFIYLAGVAGTLAGDLVGYNTDSGGTVRAVAATRGAMAVAMSANGAGSFGWYMKVGSAVTSTTAAGTGAANAYLAVTATPGRATVGGAAGQRINNVICTSAQDAPGAGYTVVQLSNPFANGDT